MTPRKNCTDVLMAAVTRCLRLAKTRGSKHLAERVAEGVYVILNFNALLLYSYHQIPALLSDISLGTGPLLVKHTWKALRLHQHYMTDVVDRWIAAMEEYDWVPENEELRDFTEDLSVYCHKMYHVVCDIDGESQRTRILRRCSLALALGNLSLVLNELHAAPSLRTHTHMTQEVGGFLKTLEKQLGDEIRKLQRNPGQLSASFERENTRDLVRAYSTPPTMPMKHWFSPATLHLLNTHLFLREGLLENPEILLVRAQRMFPPYLPPALGNPPPPAPPPDLLQHTMNTCLRESLV